MNVIELLKESEVLVTSKDINVRLDVMGRFINHAYDDNEITLLCIMNGGLQFSKDLAERLKMPVLFDYCQVSSYGYAEYNTNLRWMAEPKADSISGRDVLIVDDIFDTGRSLDTVHRYCQALGAKSIQTAVAFSKCCRKEVMLEPTYWLMEIEDSFVFGYGLDYQGYCRNLPDLWVKKS